MALGLHEAAHDAEGTDGNAVLREERRDDGVVGALSRLENVGVSLLQREAVAPVVQGDARLRDDHARAESHVVALDVGDHVPLAVGGAEVDGSSGHRVSGLPVLRLLAQQGPPGVGIGAVKKLLHGNGGVAGVRHVPVGVGEPHLDGLDLPVHREGIVVGREPETPEDGEGEKGHDALPVGRNFPDVVSPVVHADGLHPLGAEGSQVLGREVSAGLPGGGHDSVRDLALVEGPGVRGPYQFQGPGVGIGGPDLSGPRGQA